MKELGFKKLFSVCFSESRQWTDWFFSKVYVPEHEISMGADGNPEGIPASGLLLQNYAIRYGAGTLKIGYICGACTAPEARGKGLMSMLMKKALQTALKRGMAAVTLIPASDHLYFFYDKFGFATVFYLIPLRFTSMHPFPEQEGVFECTPSYEILYELERRRNGCVCHTRQQFDRIIEDLEMEGGYVVATRDWEGNMAIAFATADSESITVRTIMATDDRVALGALKAIKEHFGELEMTAWIPPRDDHSPLRSRGMMRLTDVETILAALAYQDPGLERLIRVRDRLLPSNSGLYHIHGGKVKMTVLAADAELPADVKTDLDVTPDVLARILFSNPHIGEIFNLPTTQPMLPLMLE